MSKRTVKFLWVVGIFIVVSCLAYMPFMGGIKIAVSDQKDVVKVLEEQGYTNIKITDAQFVAGAPYRGTKAFFSA